MKKLLLIALLLRVAVALSAQGVPFFKNYPPDKYGAHNINFDIKTDNHGIVYVANFEGVLYYDHASWRILHTSGLTRVTVVYHDKNDVIWAGGYNFFGKIAANDKGELELQRVGRPDLFLGEVLEIWEKDGFLKFVVNDGNVYRVQGDNVDIDQTLKTDASRIGLTDVVDTDAIDENNEIIVLTDMTHDEPVGDHMKGLVKKGHGLSFIDDDGQEVYSLTEDNGLLTNNVSWINYDNHGRVWGASENGLFSIAIPSAFSHFTVREGLKGIVMAMVDYQHQKYAGTSTGLYRLVGSSFVNVPGISHACWALLESDQKLLVATSNGIYCISDDGTVRQLTTTTCMSLFDDGTQYYSGEIDGVWLTQKSSGARQKICPLQKVSMIMKDAEGTLWIQSLYGAIMYKKTADTAFTKYELGDSEEASATLVNTGRQVTVVKTEDVEPFPYPFFSYVDAKGVVWLTDYEGRGLYRWKDGQRLTDLDQMLFPFSKIAIRSILLEDNQIWLGSDDGIVIIRTDVKDPLLATTPVLRMRSITLGNDSILWGGFSKMPDELPAVSHDDGNLRFTFSLDYENLVGESVYRYQLNNGEWTPWTHVHEASYSNLSSGSFIFNVQARDGFGRETPILSIKFYVRYPFYMRWYMNLLYLALVAAAIYIFFQLRMRQLEHDKLQLEQIVNERTAEVRNAQEQLIKQEKMATIGKLTQGLIDRILNPLNYINNFSKLSEGLVRDIKANIEDEEEHMDKENYEDTLDVLSMLDGNLKKVGEHGQNTTRTLKAMEEMLKDRSGGIVITDLCSILRQNEEMLSTYYAKDISTYHIRTTVSYPDQPVYIRVNPEQLSKVIMSIIANSVYAVIKRVEKVAKSQESAGSVEPMEISITATVSGDQVTIVARDTGIGIEQNILNKIFDPFFTTKTTGEAAGIGLYLSHEIIQNYGGEISVESVKDVFTAFTIILPIQTAPAYGTTD